MGPWLGVRKLVWGQKFLSCLWCSRFGCKWPRLEPTCPWLVPRGDRSLKRPSCSLCPMGSNLGPWNPNWGPFPKPNTLTLMPKYPKTQLRAQGIRPRPPGHLYWHLFNTGNLDRQSSLSGNCSIRNFSYRKILHRKTDNRKIYPLAIATPEFPYTGNSQPEKVRLDIIFAAFNKKPL